MSNMINILETVNKENKKVLLMGDFNIDLLKFESDARINTFIDNMISLGMLPIITKPTRVTKDTATLIDHIYLNTSNSSVTSGIIITDVADHFGVFTMIEDIAVKKISSLKQYRPFTDNNLTYFKQLLTENDYSSVLNNNDVDEAYNKFLNIYHKSYEQAFPLKTIKQKSKYTKQQPWMTEGLLASSIKKNKLFKLKLKTPTDANISKYKDYCTIYNKLRRQAKRNHYISIFNKYKHDTKNSWSAIKKIIGKASNKNNMPSSFTVHGQSISDGTQIANEFNNFFSSIGKNLADSIYEPVTNYNRHLLNKNNNSFFMSPVSPEDIIKTAKTLKPKLSEGYDNISTKLTKLTIEEICVPLSHIFNRSIQTGTVPNSMKLAIVAPIFKSGNNQLFNNYRPISILPAFSKLLEKIIYNQLYTFLNNNNILYEHQYGFRKNHSTIHPILHLIKDVVTNNDKPTKESTIGIFLDLSKAFDTISHDILLNKLDHYGIRGLTNDWFRSYLTHRKQSTRYQSFLSSWKPITHGVPQGSILGPLLFLIYINDIPNSTDLNILSFADDTTIYTSGSNIQQTILKVNSELNKIYIWLCENKLSLNINKTKFMLFSTKSQNQSNIDLKINGLSIKQAGQNHEETTIKFLGVYLEENLNWRNHINHIRNKVSRALFTINKIKNILPSSALRCLYFALVHCHFTYAILAWGNSSSINCLFNLQKRAVRIILHKSYRAHTDPLFKSLKILKIIDLHKIQVSLFAHNHTNNMLPFSFRNYYPNPRSSVVHTRISGSTNMYIPYTRTQFSKSSVYSVIPAIWNNIPHCIRSVTSKSIFISNLKKDAINSYQENIVCTNPTCRQCIS